MGSIAVIALFRLLASRPAVETIGWGEAWIVIATRGGLKVAGGGGVAAPAPAPRLALHSTIPLDTLTAYFLSSKFSLLQRGGGRSCHAESNGSNSPDGGDRRSCVGAATGWGGEGRFVRRHSQCEQGGVASGGPRLDPHGDGDVWTGRRVPREGEVLSLRRAATGALLRKQRGGDVRPTGDMRTAESGR